MKFGHWHYNEKLSKPAHHLVYDERGVLVANVGHALRSNEENRKIAEAIAALPEMLEMMRDYQCLYEAYSMQDMTPEELEGELQPDVYREVMARRCHIAKVIAKAEGQQ